MSSIITNNPLTDPNIWYIIAEFSEDKTLAAITETSKKNHDHLQPQQEERKFVRIIYQIHAIADNIFIKKIPWAMDKSTNWITYNYLENNFKEQDFQKNRVSLKNKTINFINNIITEGKKIKINSELKKFYRRKSKEYRDMNLLAEPMEIKCDVIRKGQEKVEIPLKDSKILDAMFIKIKDTKILLSKEECIQPNYEIYSDKDLISLYRIFEYEGFETRLYEDSAEKAGCKMKELIPFILNQITDKEGSKDFIKEVLSSKTFTEERLKKNQLKIKL